MKGKGFFADWHIKIACFFLAVLTVYYVIFGASTKRTITLPLTVIMPENHKAVSIIPESVDLVIQGTEDVIYMIKAEDISLIADFSSVLRDGVSSMPVRIEFAKDVDYIDNPQLFFSTNPSYVRIYFEEL